MTRGRRLSTAERADLIARYRDGATVSELAAAFGVAPGTVRYHTVNVVRPAEATARGQLLLVELARRAPAAQAVVVPAAAGAVDPSTGAPIQYTTLSPTQRALLRRRWRDGATSETLQAAFGVSAETIAGLTEGIARSPLGARRVRARVMAQARARRGFPRLHPGTSAVRITSVRGGGAELRISRELYRRLGAPARLDVGRHGRRLLLRPGSRYCVVNRATVGMPRITIGAQQRRALRLPGAGQFPARYDARRGPHLSVQLAPRLTNGADQTPTEEKTTDAQ